MRKEIEVKARAADLGALAEELEALGCTLSEPLRQEDYIFVDHDYPFDEFRTGANILRIRNQNGRSIFTVKQSQSNELDCLEHETEISDPEEMRNALLLLGYREAVQVKKVRRKTNYKEYEICLDEVDGLGSFIEVEKITEEEGADTVQEELFSFLETLGIDRSQRVENGYDTLVYRQLAS